MKQNEALDLFSSSKKVIYFIDRDIELLKRIGKQLEEHFPDYEIVGMIKLDDVADELKKNPPSVMIIDVEVSDERTMQLFFEKLRDQEVYKRLPVIITGSRQVLEQVSVLVERFELEMVPKSIRVPYLLAMVSAGLKQASSVQSRLIELKAGDFLFQEGDSGNSVYVLREGSLDVLKKSDGELIVIGHIKDQQMIGEMAYLEKKLRTASVRAVSPSKVLELQLGDVDKFLGQQPFWLNMLLTTLIQRLRDTNEHVIDLEKKLHP